LQRTQEAHETLLKALPLFPTLGIIPYNLACYACQMGKMDEARSWLRQAMEQEGREQILKRARDDRDLVALHDELGLL
jgi:Tfp pilus assembly protein PilF